MKNQPLGYHPNPFNDMVICVSSCPETATDGQFTLPDGPIGKDFARPAYPSANIYGQRLGRPAIFALTLGNDHSHEGLSAFPQCYFLVFGAQLVTRQLSEQNHRIHGTKAVFATGFVTGSLDHLRKERADRCLVAATENERLKGFWF